MSETEVSQHTTVEQVPVESLNPYENNPKEHPPEQVRKIADSIKEFGFTIPMVVDADDTIIAGHGRFKAATKHLDLDTVPVIRRTDLDESEVKAFRVADNRIAKTTWDLDLLQDEMSTIDELTRDFDMETLGFDDEELDFLTAGQNAPTIDDGGDADADTMATETQPDADPGTPAADAAAPDASASDADATSREGRATADGTPVKDVDREAEWEGMPEFDNDDLTAKREVRVKFQDPEQVEEFAKLAGWTITDKTQSVWFPPQDDVEITNYANREAGDDDADESETPDET